MGTLLQMCTLCVLLPRRLSQGSFSMITRRDSTVEGISRRRRRCCRRLEAQVNHARHGSNKSVRR